MNEDQELKSLKRGLSVLMSLGQHHTPYDRRGGAALGPAANDCPNGWW